MSIPITIQIFQDCTATTSDRKSQVVHRVCIDPLRFSHNTLLASQQEAYGTTSAQLDIRVATTYLPFGLSSRKQLFFFFKQIICRNKNDMTGRPSAQAKLAALIFSGTNHCVLNSKFIDGQRIHPNLKSDPSTFQI